MRIANPERTHTLARRGNSWHCHGYADEVHTALGVRTNSKGLIPNYEAANPS